MNAAYALLRELEHGLNEIDQLDSTTLERCSDKFNLCQHLATKFRETYLHYQFDNPELEITFFKEIKPLFYSELRYQKELLGYLKEKPKGSIKAMKQHINTSMDKVSIFISRHCEFDHYIQMGSTHQDKTYFTKQSFDPRIHGHLEHPVDMEFSAPASSTLACLLTAHRFLQFLKNELYSLKKPTLDPRWENMKSFKWKGSKTDLVELAYALYASESMNGDLKDIISIFENLFKVDLTNFYRTYSDIKYKKDPAAFINKLKASLLEKIRIENQ